MKQYTFRELQTNTGWLGELPIEVVKYGKVVVTLCDAAELVETKKMLANALAELGGGHINPAPAPVNKKPSLDELRGMISSIENREVIADNSMKYLPRKCEFYKGCSENSVGEVFMGQWYGDEWKGKDAHLCQKHIDFVKKDKEGGVL